jgi:hypothetical protein
MKRLVFAGLAATAVAACSTEQQAPSSPGTGAPSFAISDGSSGGNPHFFFLPPLVKQPTFSGTFNPNLLPSVEICHLTTDPTCQSFVQRFGPGDVTVDAGGQKYQVNWNTSPSILTSGDIYRVRVLLGPTPSGTTSACPATAGFPATGPGCREFGYLDTKPVATPQDVPGSQAPGLYVFLNGSNNPVKFRIEKFALCDPNAKDCGEGTASNGGGTISATYSNLVIPPGSISQTIGNVTIVVQKLSCTASGRVNLVPADLPQFQGCYDFQTFPAGVTFDASYIVGMCLLRPTGLLHAQEDMMQIHKFEPTNPGAGVEALAEATATIDCTNFGTITTASANPILNLAHRLEVKVRGWLSPTVAFAAHLGGGTGSRSLSHMVWAIPSQMAKLAGDNQNVLAGTAVPIPPSVKVTDVGGNPVQGATVFFSASAGSSIALPPSAVPCLSDPLKTCVPTDVNGVAQVASWVVGPPSGTYTLTASGVGLGSSPTTSGVLTTGSVTFTATACTPGFGTATIDGVINSAEWQCAQHIDFNANLSGGNAPATLYWMNDGSNLYLAVKVQRSVNDKINTLQFNFDNNASAPASGIAETNDDILIEDGATGFSDNYLTLKCTNSSQSSCGATDASGGGAANGAGATQWQSGYRMYEIKHPLSSGDVHDIARVAGQQLGFFLTLQQGSGAQGNTQWPGFRSYRKITIQ